MAMNSGGGRDRHRRIGLVFLALMATLSVSSTMPREAVAQATRKARQKPRPDIPKGDGAKDTPKASRPEDSKAPEPAEPLPPLEFETVKLDDGSEVPDEKWDKTYPAYDYRPPIDILDRRVHVVLDSHTVQGAATSLEIDPDGGRLYWCESVGRVMRAHLDGTRAETLATGRLRPRSLVLDKLRGKIYWLQGEGLQPCTLQTATLDGKKERTLSRGLNRANGLALDAARGHLYYWENYRLVRVDVDGTGEEVVTTNVRVVRPDFGSLEFDAARGRLLTAFGPLYRWFDRDGTHPGTVPRMEHWANIHGFTFDEVYQKIYLANGGRALMRASVDGTQVETLVAAPVVGADGLSRSIAGDIALDRTRGHLYFTVGGDSRRMVCRTDFRPPSKPTIRPAPPRITAISPAEQATGGKIGLSGLGLTDAVAVTFIDDSTGALSAAEFSPLGQGQLAVTVPQLGEGCRRPVIVVQSPSGVTMTLGTDVVAPKIGVFPYQDVRSIPLDEDPRRDAVPLNAGNGPYQHERAIVGAGARVWLRPGKMSGNLEVAVVYAMRGSTVGFGPKGMVTAFAKDDSYVAFTPHSQVETVVYHEPFAVLSKPIHHDASVRLIPVPAIRPSFPETPFRYLAERRRND